MVWLKRLLVLIAALVVLLSGYWIAAENTAEVSLVLFGFTLPAMAQGLVFCLALFVGVLLGCLVSLVPVLRLTLAVRGHKKSLRRRDAEIDVLRSNSAGVLPRE